MKISDKAQKAIFIGLLCAIAYLAVYIARNILGAVTPKMLEDGYDESYIGRVSSVYFAFYAIGQLINGVLGNKIKAKYMICFGLSLAGVSNFLFSRLGNYPNVAVFAYGSTGFFLSMIYGPMSKIVAENNEPAYAARCSLGYTFSQLLGTPLAGVFAAVFTWQSAFTVSSVLLVAMAVFSFFGFIFFEKRGFIKYDRYTPVRKKGGNVKVLFKRQIVKFTLIDFLTGIIRTSVVFWMPTYFSQYLGFSSAKAASVFTAATFIVSLTAFLAVFVYERLKRNMDLHILLSFALSALLFFALYIVKQPVLNVVCMVGAVMWACCASAMRGLGYLPSIRDTGMVSGVAGFLDGVSYLAAALANLIFPNAVAKIGWGNLILVWLCLMVCGVLLSLPYSVFRKRKTAKETAADTAEQETEPTVEEVACENDIKE